MALRNVFASETFRSWCARLLVAPLVVLSGVWVYLLAPTTFDVARTQLIIVGDNLLRSQSFPKQDLEDLAAAAATVKTDALCHPFDTQNLLVVQVALAEIAFNEGDADAADKALRETVDLAHRTLYCNPYSSTAWTVLGWESFVRDDASPRMIALMDMSYRTGPFDGWSIVRRLGLMLPMVAQLDAAHQEVLRTQIAAFVQDGLLDVLVGYYVGGNAAQKAFLQAEFARLGQPEMKRIDELVRNAGADIDLPLAEARGSRPWAR